MSNFKKSLYKQLVVNVLIIVVAVVLFKGVSYSVDNDSTNDNKDLLIQTGNMQVVLNVPNEQYKVLDNNGYNFSITNTGNIPIEYYEIRLVNEENKISTLPYYYLNYRISKDNGSYSELRNLGNMDGIIYMGDNLSVGKTETFNLQMELDSTKLDFYNKELYSALEVTLYQKNEINNNYVLYTSDGGENIPFRTSIYSPISSMIPQKAGYKFLGWSTVLNGEVKYQAGDTFKEKKGATLYAIWEKVLVG